MKIGNMKKTLLSLGCLAAMLGLASSSSAVTYGFDQLTSNGGAAGVAGQLAVVIEDAGGGQVSFTFHNKGSLASSITDVYFDDGTLLGIASVSESTGVAYSQNASPGELPSGNTATPPFETSEGFSADSDSPSTQANGVNATVADTEYVTILFDLINAKTFADTLAALADGSLRIGIHVQGYASGDSESFINNTTETTVLVPDGGSTIAMLGFALMGADFLRRKIRKA
jgi:hypothetical protein